MKKFFLPVTKTYVQHWTIEEAVRELLQNAIDAETEDPQNKKRISFSGKHDNWTITIESELSKLSLRTLLLGGGTKSNNQELIGKFGEGYKLAVLVFLRLGHKLTIKNGKENWNFKFEFNQDFEEEILTLEITESKRKTDIGLSFVVDGITAEERATIEVSSLFFDKYEVVHTAKGDLVEGSVQAFVGGLATHSLNCIKADGLEYSFNYRPKDVALDRDRRSLTDAYSSYSQERVARIMEELPSNVFYRIMTSKALETNGLYNFEGYFRKDTLKRLRKHLVDQTFLVDDNNLNQFIRHDDDFYESYVIVQASHDRIAQLKQDTSNLIVSNISERVAKCLDTHLQESIVEHKAAEYRQQDIDRLLNDSNLAADIIKWIKENYADVDESALFSLIALFKLPDSQTDTIKDLIRNLKEIL